jgi:prephenate dehydrogenase
MTDATFFRRVAIIGTGLIGGSFALALRKHSFGISIVGFDRQGPLDRALGRRVVDEAAAGIAEAVRGADLVYVALPIAATIEALPTIAAAAAPQALVTDACSTKAVICRIAGPEFKGHAMFLGGHPLAGKEHSGIDQADADLFHDAPYALVRPDDENDARLREFTHLLHSFSARPVWCDPETHDWAVGIVSHLPQLVSIALASVVQDETDETGLPLTLAGQGLEDVLRLAGSPYGIWRDILLTNSENIGRALDRLAQAIDNLRTHLTSKELVQEFHTANELYNLLHKTE